MRTRNSWSCWRFWVTTRKKDLLSSLWTNRSTQTDCSKTWWKPRTPACLYMEVVSHTLTLTAIWWITKLLWHHPLVSQGSFRSLISCFFSIILNFHWLAACQSLFNFRYLGWSGLFKQRPGILKSLIKPHEFIFFCPPNVNIQSVSFISVSYIFRFLFCYGHIYYKLVILCLEGIDQYDRDSIINDFKNGACRLMVATSVAARGLDVKQLILVVNYNCPNHYEDYVHRAGRTGRAGNKVSPFKGSSFNFRHQKLGNLCWHLGCFVFGGNHV